MLVQRTGIADGGEFYICPTGNTAWPFDKVKYQELKLGFIRQALNRSTTELPLLIVSTSNPTIGNTNVYYVQLLPCLSYPSSDINSYSFNVFPRY